MDCRRSARVTRAPRVYQSNPESSQIKLTNPRMACLPPTHPTRSRLVSAQVKVNRFKALVIGGGGIFAAEHAPLFQDAFAEAVNVPIVVVGVGAK